MTSDLSSALEVCFKRDALNKSMFTLLYFTLQHTWKPTVIQWWPSCDMVKTGRHQISLFWLVTAMANWVTLQSLSSDEMRSVGNSKFQQVLVVVWLVVPWNSWLLPCHLVFFKWRIHSYTFVCRVLSIFTGSIACSTKCCYFSYLEGNFEFLVFHPTGRHDA